MKNKTINIVKNSLKYLSDQMFISVNIGSMGYLPRWIILMIDLCIISFSGILTYFLFQGIDLNFVPQQNVVLSFGVYILVNLVFFLLLKTYSGIIRHSSLIDAIKLLIALFAIALTLILISWVCLGYVGEYLFLRTGVFFNLGTSFCLLFIYRVIVKQLFENFTKHEKGEVVIKAMILGTDANALAAAGALKSENPKRFKIIGFIDRVGHNSMKRLLDLPIFNVGRSITVLMRVNKVDALIIADKSLTKEERTKIVEDCIQYNFKVYTIPLVSDWNDKGEISKSIKSFEIQDLLERSPIVLDTKSISHQLKNKTILITGGAGSIGSEIVRQVIKFNPSKIVLIDQAETPLNSMYLELMAMTTNVELITLVGDICNADFMRKVYSEHRPHVVYHAAAYKHVPMMEANPAQAIFTNVMGTKLLADLACEFETNRFVMVSTDKAVNPSSVMGASKRIAEMYVQSYYYNSNKNCGTTKFITTRFGNVLGSNGSVVPLFTKQIQEGGPITITHPEIIRYFMTIPEACQLVLEAGTMGEGGEIFIFDMGKPVRIIDLARKMIRLAGYQPDKDIAIKIVGLRPGEKLYEELLNNSAKDLPTHHEKIMIAQENCLSYDQVNSSVLELYQLACVGDFEKIVSKMKEIVPEYKSLNSVYQELDK